MEVKENAIIIVNDSSKERFIEDFRKDHPFFAVTILGLEEFKKKYYFDFSKEAVFYIHQKYQVIPDIARIYLENIYFIKDGISTPKVEFLKNLKDDLDEHKLLEYDPNFKNFLEGKDIVLYKLEALDNFYERMFDDLGTHTFITRVEDQSDETIIKPLYKLPNREKEVAFVAGEIAQLIKRGIDINRIKIANVNADYIFPLKRAFKDFKIPLELPNSMAIGGTLLVAKFIEFFDDNIKETLEKIKPLVKSENDEYVYSKIISCLNDYYWCQKYSDVKDLIIEDLRKIKQKTKTLKNAVRTIDFLQDSIDDNDYVFLINFNQGSISKNKKDEDYLPDSTKLSLGLSDSIDINKKRVALTRKRIEAAAHLTVTYSARGLSGELYISNAYDENILENRSYEESFEHSNAYNRRILICEKDMNKKYGTVTDNLKLLAGHYKNEPYNTYDNTFKGIDSSALKEYLENKLTLSYSSMDHYFKCSFRYYLDYILKLDSFEDSFATVIGNIFHEVLSVCFIEPFDFEEAWTKAYEHQTFEFKGMEKFYLGLLKEELIFVIANLKDQMRFSKLDKALYEQKILVPVEVEGEVVFKGFVDKILYNEESKVAAIVDYKTGQPELNIDDIIYGLDLQLPIYAYLLKHFEPLNGVSIGGFYLQRILNNKKDETEKRNALKLQGYSNSNPRILGEVDTTYEDSALIKSMKMSKGDFCSYVKVLTDEEIDRMTTLVEDKIKEAAQNILDGKFNIDPKELLGKNRGCEFCTYKDICYVKNDNIVKLKKQKKEDFLGGEDNGLD